MAIVIPDPGKLAETARLLLSLADNVHDVKTVGNGMSFDVPDELADRYHDRMSGPVQQAPATPRKRRGRSPRMTEEN